MADFTFNASAAVKAGDRQDVQYETIELPEVSHSIAPSQSKSRYSLFKADDDDKSILKHTWSSTLTPSNTYRIGSVSRERNRRLKGWRFGVTFAACAAFLVMLVNLILTIIAAAKFRDNIENGIGTAYQGDCKVIDGWSTALHIVINVLSSMLLSASNYTMQCLCSPTRKEIDVAHSKGDWLDIGLPSVRNILGRISVRRMLFWWILALTSAPIHLLYNSSVFKTLDANLYGALVVNKDFLNGQPFSNETETINSLGITDTMFASSQQYARLRQVQLFFAANASNGSAVQNMSNTDCMTAYGTFFVSGRNDVLLITKQSGNTPNQTLLSTFQQLNYGTAELTYNWICGDYTANKCDVPSTRREHADDWIVGGHGIDYCLSQLQPSHCKLQFSLAILGVVIAMNFCKCASMFWTVFWQRLPTLVTVGDALASFLDSPDELTRGRCLSAKVDISSGPLRWCSQGAKLPNTKPPAKAYHARFRRRWFAAASMRRWAVTMGLCSSALIVAAALLSIGVHALRYNNQGQDPFTLGFGAVDTRTLISAGVPKSLVGVVLLANLPQTIVSFLYLTYNGLLTSMLLSSEWSRYFLRPKSLRTTTPRGSQRSKYYLHLPYTYSIPLLVASALLHWLISESIFLARVDMWNNGEFEGSSSQVGYSCLPLLLVIMLGTVMLTAAFALGFRKFASHMPVAGSCSVAISAACHRPKDDVDAAYLPVSWGEVPRDDPDDDVHHCCFTSHATQELVPGRLYAGERHVIDIQRKNR